MKKYIILSLLTLFSFELNAQHLSFMGIPITGTPSAFADSLKERKFISKEPLCNTINCYSGTFAGENVTVYVCHKYNLVWKVSVEFPKHFSFYDLETEYDKFVENFTAKYGEPTDEFRYFSYPYYKGDGYESSAVQLGKCHYATFWEKSSGAIMIKIYSSKQVNIAYEDKQSANYIENKDKQNIQNEI